MSFVANIVQPVCVGNGDGIGEGARMGVKIDDKCCGALLYTNVIVLLANTGVELQDMLAVVHDYVVR